MKLVTTVVLLAFTTCGLMAKVDQIPQAIKRKNIDFPAAISAPARVDVLLTIEADGRVSSAATNSSSNHDLDDACLEALAAWIYTPATANGKPVTVRAIQPVVVYRADGRGNDSKFAAAD